MHLANAREGETERERERERAHHARTRAVQRKNCITPSDFLNSRTQLCFAVAVPATSDVELISLFFEGSAQI